MGTTNFPVTAIDGYGADVIDNTDDVLAEHINDPRAAIIAIETKIGLNSTAVATTIDYLLKHTSSIDPGHKHNLATGAVDVSASEAEIDLVCDGILATAAEVNNACNGATAKNTHEHFPIGGITVMLFGQDSAPTGWTRKSDWPTDNAMICYAKAGSVAQGGSANPKSTHTHTGPDHTHTGPSHQHTGPSHTHGGLAHQHTTAGHVLDETEMPSHVHEERENAGGGTYRTGANGATWTPHGSTRSTGPAGSDASHAHGDTGAIVADDTDADGTGVTGLSGTAVTGGGGTGATGPTTAPAYVEVIAATLD